MRNLLFVAYFCEKRELTSFLSFASLTPLFPSKDHLEVGEANNEEIRIKVSKWKKPVPHVHQSHPHPRLNPFLFSYPSSQRIWRGKRGQSPTQSVRRAEHRPRPSHQAWQSYGHSGRNEANDQLMPYAVIAVSKRVHRFIGETFHYYCNLPISFILDPSNFSGLSFFSR